MTEITKPSQAEQVNMRRSPTKWLISTVEGKDATITIQFPVASEEYSKPATNDPYEE